MKLGFMTAMNRWVSHTSSRPPQRRTSTASMSAAQ
jgi:hypothetical protein